ncbi:MAG: hypothetical protein GY870_12935, partial [archaeon]|nr:hypothetical protein [archaeon]
MHKKNDINIISESKFLDIDERFVGPKALFDPYFIPDFLVNREKEERYLNSLLSDAIIDTFPASISLFGLNGVGKTVLVNKTINSILGTKSEISKNEFSESLFSFLINCEGKDTEQIIFSMINSLAKKLKYDIKPEIVLNSNRSALWNLFKFLTSKIESPLIFVFDSVEYVQPKLLNKITKNSKSESFITINSFNISQSSPFLLDFDQPDYKMQLGTYSKKDLLEISRDRCAISIKNPVEDDMVKYIVDLACEFDKNVPESPIRILRELYPILDNSKTVFTSKIRDVCRYQFDGFSIDEIGIAEFISESEILERIILDNLCSHFIQSDAYYIGFNELKDTYNIAVESLEYTSSDKEFYSILTRLRNISLLIPSG